MRVAVFSDTHSVTSPMVDAVRRSHPDVLIHLGDHERDAGVLLREFPEIPLYQVSGNCDFASFAPLTLAVPIGPVRVFLTHGHLYAAKEENAQLALFGHTHIPFHEDIGGVKVINPGSAGRGRPRTWALLEIFENGGIAAEIRNFE